MTDKSDYVKMENFSSSKTQIKEQRQAIDYEKIFKAHATHRGI